MTQRELLTLLMVLGLWSVCAPVSQGESVDAGQAVEQYIVYPYLVSDRQFYAPSNDVNLSCSLRVAEGRTAEVHTSTLLVTDTAGTAIVSKENAWTLLESGEKTRHLKGGFSSSVEHGLLPRFSPGEYKAVWRVDNALSNVVTFRVTDELTNVQALTIESVNKRNRIPYELHLIVRFHNRTKEPVNLFEAFLASNLFVDGTSFKRMMSNWNGSIMLASGASWGTFLSFDEYEPKISPGVHEVQFEFAGQRSNVLTVDWR